MGDEHRRAALTPLIEFAKEPTLDSVPSSAAETDARRADLLTDATLALAFLYRHFRLMAAPAAPVAGLRPLH